jgi:hypothetical protein
MGKKVSELTALPVGDITEATDLLAVFDTGANKLKKISVEDFLTLAPGLDIVGLTAISFADIGASDVLPIYDIAAAANKKVTVQFLFDYVTKNLDDVSTIASGDIVQASDFVFIYDASLGNVVKLSVTDFLSLAGGGGLTNWTESTAGSGTNTRSKFLATGAETNIDAVVAPKGNGAFRTNDDSGSCGIYAVDLQLQRVSSGQTASGVNAVVCGGYANTAAGSYSAVTGGVNNFATQDYARSGGNGASAARTGEDAWSSGKDGAITGVQFSRIVMSKEVVGIAETELLIDGANLATRIGVSANQHLHIIVNALAVCTAVGNGTSVYGDTFGRVYTAAVKRLVNTTSTVGTPTPLSAAMADATMTDCAFTITGDDALDAIKITFTPPSTAGTTSVYYAAVDVQITQIWL